MKRRNASWTYYLKTDTGRQVLWLSLVLSAASLLVAGIALPIQVQSRPSDKFDNSHFLTFNGIDTAVSACKYYKAIRAITNRNIDCDRVGPENFDFLQPGDGKTFNDWKLENGLRINPDFNGNGNPFDDDTLTGEVSALYFNAVDLALVRSMHGKTSVVNGVKTTAYYVCNYNTFEDAGEDADNRNAIACVAFDYSADRPFTKFYVFVGGNLSPFADLDGKKKFVPGLCKACHGGDKQPRQPFDDDDRPNGDIGAHFLPFDLDNFEYLEDSAFSRRAQEGKFKRLNQMILETDPAPVVKQLIDGWYLGARTEQDREFIPSGWKGHEQLYRRVVKPSCRTCHVAMRPGFNFDTFGGFENLASATQQRVCVDAGVNLPPEVVRLSRSMPNSKVTFDQFWLDRVRRTVLARFLRDALGDPRLQCPPP